MKKMKAVSVNKGKVIYKEVDIKLTHKVDDVYAWIISLEHYVPVKTNYVRPAFKANSDALIEEHEAGKDWKMNHGIIKIGKDWYVHCWLEKGNKVWDKYRRIKCSRSQYITKWQVHYDSNYDYKTVRYNMADTRTYGPWSPDLVALVKLGIGGFKKS